MTTKLIDLNRENNTVIQVNEDVYIGKAKDIIDLLIEFSIDECTDCFYENNGVKDLDDYHIELAMDYLNEVRELMQWLKDENCTADRIVKAYVGPIDHISLEVDHCD